MSGEIKQSELLKRVARKNIKQSIVSELEGKTVKLGRQTLSRLIKTEQYILQFKKLAQHLRKGSSNWQNICEAAIQKLQEGELLKLNFVNIYDVKEIFILISQKEFKKASQFVQDNIIDIMGKQLLSIVNQIQLINLGIKEVYEQIAESVKKQKSRIQLKMFKEISLKQAISILKQEIMKMVERNALKSQYQLKEQEIKRKIEQQFEEQRNKINNIWQEQKNKVKMQGEQLRVKIKELEEMLEGEKRSTKNLQLQREKEQAVAFASELKRKQDEFQDQKKNMQERISRLSEEKNSLIKNAESLQVQLQKEKVQAVALASELKRKQDELQDQIKRSEGSPSFNKSISILGTKDAKDIQIEQLKKEMNVLKKQNQQYWKVQRLNKDLNDRINRILDQKQTIQLNLMSLYSEQRIALLRQAWRNKDCFDMINGKLYQIQDIVKPNGPMEMEEIKNQQLKKQLEKYKQEHQSKNDEASNNKMQDQGQKQNTKCAELCVKYQKQLVAIQTENQKLNEEIRELKKIYEDEQEAVKEAQNKLKEAQGYNVQLQSQIVKLKSEIPSISKSSPQKQQVLKQYQQAAINLQIDPLFICFLDTLFRGTILQGKVQEKTYLISQLRQFTQKRVTKTRFLYQFDPENYTSFHKYLDRKSENLLCIVKTLEGQLLGCYYSGSYLKGDMKEPALLFSLSQKESFRKREGEKDRGMIHEDFFIIFGNSELRINPKADKRELFSNLGVNNGFFDNRGATVNVLLGKGDNSRTVTFESFEFYEILFEEKE